MRRHLKKVRRSSVTREELTADGVFLLVSGFLSLIIVFLFDIHHSFYGWPMELKFIFKTPFPYMLFVPVGSIAGLLLIKLLLFGMKEERFSR